MFFKKIAVMSANILLQGGVYLPPGDHKDTFPLVILCHGIPSGNKKGKNQQEEGYPGLARKFAKKGFAACYFNFRGTGESQGDFYLPGWQDDLKEVIDYLVKQVKIDNSNIFLVGFSGGAATAAYAAAGDSRVSGTALAACPSHFSELFPEKKLPEILQRGKEIGLFRTPGFPSNPRSWLEGFHRVIPRDVVANISPRPLLILHGDKDELVPVDAAHELYAAAKEPKELQIVTGARHQLRKEPAALQVIMSWLKKFQS